MINLNAIGKQIITALNEKFQAGLDELQVFEEIFQLIKLPSGTYNEYVNYILSLNVPEYHYVVWNFLCDHAPKDCPLGPFYEMIKRRDRLNEQAKVTLQNGYNATKPFSSKSVLIEPFAISENYDLKLKEIIKANNLRIKSQNPNVLLFTLSENVTGNTIGFCVLESPSRTYLGSSSEIIEMGVIRITEDYNLWKEALHRLIYEGFLGNFILHLETLFSFLIEDCRLHVVGYDFHCKVSDELSCQAADELGFELQEIQRKATGKLIYTIRYNVK